MMKPRLSVPHIVLGFVVFSLFALSIEPRRVDPLLPALLIALLTARWRLDRAATPRATHVHPVRHPPWQPPWRCPVSDRRQAEEHGLSIVPHPPWQPTRQSGLHALFLSARHKQVIALFGRQQAISAMRLFWNLHVRATRCPRPARLHVAHTLAPIVSTARRRIARIHRSAAPDCGPVVIAALAAAVETALQQTEIDGRVIALHQHASAVDIEVVSRGPLRSAQLHRVKETLRCLSPSPRWSSATTLRLPFPITIPAGAALAPYKLPQFHG